MSEEVKIGRKYAVVIPRNVRKKLGLKEGQRALVREEVGRVVIEPLPDDPYQVLRQTLGNFSYTESKYERKAERWLRRVARTRH